MLNPRSLFTSLALVSVLCLTVVAQTGTSNITGTVRDTNGFVVPGAAVRSIVPA